jgi:hypothetical protein
MLHNIQHTVPDAPRESARSAVGHRPLDLGRSVTSGKPHLPSCRSTAIR